MSLQRFLSLWNAIFAFDQMEALVRVDRPSSSFVSDEFAELLLTFSSGYRTGSNVERIFFISTAVIIW